VERIAGVVQHYDWGDPVTIPRLLGREPDGRPWAELWLGTHPGGPATAGRRALEEVTGPLPYLLKVLSAAAPLSLQTHPDAQQARDGHAREDRDGIPADAPQRVYRDPHPKPELLCALTPFAALSGFRPVEESVPLLRAIGLDDLAAQVVEDGLRAAVEALYRGRHDVAALVRTCRTARAPEARLVAELDDRHPGDPSVAVTLLLHHVELAPGEAIFLGPGNLHAYLHGTGVEIMSASDNVVRGGLTSKHVDVDELLRVLDVRPLPAPRLAALEVAPRCHRYDTPGTPFRLWRLDVDGTCTVDATGRELLLCTDGAAGPLATGQAVALAPGERVDLAGRGTVFRVEERAPATA